MTASQQAWQQCRPGTDGALGGLPLPVGVVGDYPLIALEFSPVDIAFVPIMQQNTPFLAWQTHAIANTSASARSGPSPNDRPCLACNQLR
jgi:hypothetical protein